MKRAVLVCCCALVSLPAPVLAQADEPADSPADAGPWRVQFGVLVGAAIADMGGTERQMLLPDAPDASFEASDKLFVGGFVNVALSARWSARIEVLYAEKGGVGVDAVGFPDLASGHPDCGSSPPGPGCPFLVASYRLDHILRYIQVPILAQYEVRYDGRVRPRLFAGVAPALRVGAELVGEGQIQRATGAAAGEPVGTLAATADIEDHAERFDLALLAGASVSFPAGPGAVLVGVRYSVGLLPVVDGRFTVDATVDSPLTGAEAEVPVEATSLRHRGLELYAGYEF